uniref:Uncharacterized protein n=1 Tax=Plectus sambesii TaxID=2011161 RepID=A0A914XES4_9BILA
MDAEKSASAAGEELGEKHLSSPQDVCLIPNDDLIAVSDGTNGLVVLDQHGNVEHHFSQIKDCGSLCLNRTTNELAVTVCAEDPDTSESSYQLWLVDCDFWRLGKEKFDFPTEPAVKSGYIRWICADQESGNYVVAYGDNDVAVMQKFDVESSSWRTLLERTGLMEHPCIINKEDGAYDVFVAVWNEEQNWHIGRFSFDRSDELLSEEIVVQPDGVHIKEPWAALVLWAEGLAVHDCKEGLILRVAKTEEGSWIPCGILGTVQPGQWISLDADNHCLYASCSEEKLIRRFKLDQ